MLIQTDWTSSGNCRGDELVILIDGDGSPPGSIKIQQSLNILKDLDIKLTQRGCRPRGVVVRARSLKSYLKMSEKPSLNKSRGLRFQLSHA